MADADEQLNVREGPKLTEHLQLWKADADAMGIPENIQRGLAFMAGINLVVNGAPVNQADLPILAA